jgi:hypothetical protein
VLGSGGAAPGRKWPIQTPLKRHVLLVLCTHRTLPDWIHIFLCLVWLGRTVGTRRDHAYACTRDTRSLGLDCHNPGAAGVRKQHRTTPPLPRCLMFSVPPSTPPPPSSPAHSNSTRAPSTARRRQWAIQTLGAFAGWREVRTRVLPPREGLRWAESARRRDGRRTQASPGRGPARG